MFTQISNATYNYTFLLSWLNQQLQLMVQLNCSGLLYYGLHVSIVMLSYDVQCKYILANAEWLNSIHACYTHLHNWLHGHSCQVNVDQLKSWPFSSILKIKNA